MTLAPNHTHSTNTTAKSGCFSLGKILRCLVVAVGVSFSADRLGIGDLANRLIARGRKRRGFRPKRGGIGWERRSEGPQPTSATGWALAPGAFVWTGRGAGWGERGDGVSFTLIRISNGDGEPVWLRPPALGRLCALMGVDVRACVPA